MKYFHSMPFWVKIATFFLLASLVTFAFKKPTFFPWDTNINDLFLFVSFIFFVIAVYKKQISIVVPRYAVIGGLGILGTLALGTAISLVFFHTITLNALREYIRVCAVFIICIEAYVIGMHHEQFLRHALFALVAPSLLLPIMLYAPSTTISFFLDASRTRFDGFLFDPNYYATLQLLPTFILLWITLAQPFGKKIIYSLFSFLLFTLSIGSIMWSGSRGGILGLFVGIGVIICFIIWKLTWKQALLYSSIIILGIIFSYFLVPQKARDDMSYRVRSVVLVSKTQPAALSVLSFTGRQGRLTIWESAIHEIVKNPLGYGPGYGSIANIKDEFDDGHKVAHNTLLQIFLTGGFMLFIIFTFGAYKLAKMFFASKMPLGKAHYLVAALVGIGIAGFFLDSLWSRWVWIMIPLIILLLRKKISIPNTR